MLTTIDPTLAKIRVAGLDAQIKDLRAQIKRLEAKKAVYKTAAANTPAEPTDDDTSTEDD